MGQRAPRSIALSFILIAAALAGCAGVKQGAPSGAGGSSAFTGAGGQSGTTPPPGQLDGLVTLAVSPPTQTVTFTTGMMATATYLAKGTFSDGSSRDVTQLVQWKSSAPTIVTVAGGVATARGAGAIDVIATSGAVSGKAQLLANVTGTVLGAGFSAGDQAALDGAATPGAADIAYPLDGALFPGNWGAVTVHVAKSSASQTSARLAITGTGVDIKYYGACEPGPNSASPTDSGRSPGCYVTLPSAFTSTLAASSEAGDLSLTARLGGAGGVVEGHAIKVAWTSVLLTGGLYYWTTINNGATTAIYRYDFSGDASKPQVVYTDMQVKDPSVDGARCIGCHALSQDGKKMAMTLGGSYPASFQMVDVATGDRLTYEAPPIDQGYAAQTAFNHDGSRMLQMFRGKFQLRTTDAAPMELGEQLTSIKENKSDGVWSPDGKLFAFASFDPAAIVNDGDPKYAMDSDMKTGAQLWITDSDDQQITDAPRVLVARKPGFTSYYPSISDDDQLVVFDQSDCSGPSGHTQYGTSPCDSYDDASASLNVVSTAGGAPVTLARANGTAANMGNSWPRWSPDHGTFRGKTLYWVAFSSRRPYGLQVNQKGYDQSTPQLWFAAVTVDDTPSAASDPSFAAVWLPGQNPNQATPNGSHVPVWVETVVVLQ